MIANYQRARGYPGPVGERALLVVIAGIVGDDGDALFLQLQRNRFPDAAAAAGDDCDACHKSSSPTGYRMMIRPRRGAPQVDRNVNRKAIREAGRLNCKAAPAHSKHHQSQRARKVGVLGNRYGVSMRVWEWWYR